MVCAFTKLMKGVLVRDDKAESVIFNLYKGWCQNYCLPSVGFYADSRGQFRNYKMEEFVSNLGLQI